MEKSDKIVRIGFMSRIDYGSDGFRQAAVERAAEIFKIEDVALVAVAGGLVSGRAVDRKTMKLGKELRAENKKLKASLAASKAGKKKLAELEDEKSLNAEQKKVLAAMKAELEKHSEQESASTKLIASLKEKLSALSPEKMAEDLAASLPHFTNASGKTVKLYIVPSSPYDRDVGIATAELLGTKRSLDELRVLTTDGDRLPLWEDQPYERILEILTPDKKAWLRGEYDSTTVQSRIRDKSRQTSSGKKADIQVVGGVGVSLLKPQGQYPIGFVALPVCHRIEETTTAERQIGVTVVEIDRDRRNVTMRSYSFRDLISRERSFIATPSDLTAQEQKCIDVLKRENSRVTTGNISDQTGLSREQVVKTLSGVLASLERKRRKTWPGLTYDQRSDRWDFDLEWVKMNLRYPKLPTEMKTDNVVIICCMHASSLDTDYKHFLTDVPRVMLEQGATMLVSAGDHIEGTAHDLLMKGEIYAGLDNTKQEKLAALMIAHVLYTVFKARFNAAIKEAGAKALSRDEVSALVRKTLPKFRYVPGNHCGWISRSGIQPLITMIHEIIRNLTLWISAHLSEKDQGVDDLMKLVESHIETVGDGRFTLPSGLAMGMTHPHMGGSKTVSSSAQQALEMYRDCPVVIIGNFHTGCVVEQWDTELGQRICIQVGTMKHSSPFESSKLKSGLDQGFAWAKIDSVGGRVVRTETTFYSNDKAKREEKRLDGDKPFDDFVKSLGIKQP